MFVEEKEVGEYQRLDDAGKRLLKAAALIEAQGWIQGQCRTNAGFCIQGALKHVSGSHGGFAGDPAYERVRNVIGSSSVVGWNDAKGRTKEEVIAKLRTAALWL